MAKPQRPAIFKWRHFAPEVILCAVRWYLRYSLSYREVQELLVERGLEIDHTTVWRWVQHYAPELEERTRPYLKETAKKPGQRLQVVDCTRMETNAEAKLSIGTEHTVARGPWSLENGVHCFHLSCNWLPRLFNGLHLPVTRLLHWRA